MTLGRPKGNYKTLECEYIECSNVFTLRYTTDPKRFCSYSCISKGARTQLPLNKENNPNWRGGKSSHELYFVYHAMIDRCTKPNNKQFTNYGGRGIDVCQRWKDNFWNFVEDVGKRPSGFSLDRINNDGSYEPTNIRWATAKEQANNKRGFGPIRERNDKGQFI